MENNNMKNDAYIVCVQMPNMPQQMLPYPTEKDAIDAVTAAIETGVISSVGELGRLFISICDGTVFAVMPREAVERQIRQQQLMATTGRGARGC